MGRSKWKGPNVLLKIVKKKPIYIERNLEIVANYLGQTFFVHNGKTFSKLEITTDHIGHKFGEFAFTRAKFSFKKKKIKK